MNQEEDEKYNKKKMKIITRTKSVVLGGWFS